MALLYAVLWPYGMLCSASLCVYAMCLRAAVLSEPISLRFATLCCAMLLRYMTQPFLCTFPPVQSTSAGTVVGVSSYGVNRAPREKGVSAKGPGVGIFLDLDHCAIYGQDLAVLGLARVRTNTKAGNRLVRRFETRCSCSVSYMFRVAVTGRSPCYTRAFAGYPLSAYEPPMQCPVLTERMLLSACYAMSGTGLEHLVVCACVRAVHPTSTDAKCGTGSMAIPALTRSVVLAVWAITLR
eukprot:3940514-Rhodomonas_salina.1